VNTDLDLPYEGVEGRLTRKGAVHHEGEHQAVGNSCHLMPHFSSGAARILSTKEVARRNSKELCAKSTTRPFVPDRGWSREVRHQGILSEHEVTTTEEKSRAKAAGVEEVHKRRIHAHLGEIEMKRKNQ